MKYDNNVSLLDWTTRKRTQIYEGALPKFVSNSENFIITENLELVSLTTNTITDLGASYPSVNYAYPGDETAILLHDDNQTISIYSYSLDDIIQTIEIDDLPRSVQINHEEFVTREFRAPIYNAEGELIFMIVRNSEFYPPDYQCD